MRGEGGITIILPIVNDDFNLVLKFDCPHWGESGSGLASTAQRHRGENITVIIQTSEMYLDQPPATQPPWTLESFIVD